MNNWIIVMTSMWFLVSCSTEQKESKETWKEEVLLAEAEFARMAQEKGVEEAFLHFIADNGVIVRGSDVLEGKEGVKKYMSEQPFDSVQLNWKPDFVDVSESGDMAYTYGKFIFQAKDTTGRPVAMQGIFHTVWKRQPDGTWKFVFD
jgi:ketosteroid isomerase-like protein